MILRFRGNGSNNFTNQIFELHPYTKTIRKKEQILDLENPAFVWQSNFNVERQDKKSRDSDHVKQKNIFMKRQKKPYYGDSFTSEHYQMKRYCLWLTSKLTLLSRPELSAFQAITGIPR